MARYLTRRGLKKVNLGNSLNALLLGSLSAGTSYFLSMVLNDFGLKFRNTIGGDENETA